jgi:hypothetical protein
MSNALANLSPGSRLRVVASDLDLNGSFRGLDTVALSMVVGSTVRVIPLSAIDGVWVEESRAKKGAVIGAIGLGVVGLAFTGALAGGYSEDLERPATVVLDRGSGGSCGRSTPWVSCRF